jgi:tol-pal system protein YbgF
MGITIKAMKRIAIACFCIPGLLVAQKNTELREVQRDVGLLAQDVRELKSTVDKVAASADQAAQNSKTNGQSIANLDRIVSDRLREQEQRTSVPLAMLGTKIDEIARENSALRTQIDDFQAQMKKMQAQMKDLTDAVQMLVANVGRPQPSGGSPDPAGADASGPAAPPAGVTPEQLYTEALQAKQAQKADAAMDQFQRYLRWYGNTDMASSAQFHIGDIHFNAGRSDDALKAFDKVLTEYPEGPKYPDAIYMKGLCYVKQGQRDKAATEFRNVTRRFPNSAAGRLAKDQLADMGLRVNPVAPAAKKRVR